MVKAMSKDTELASEVTAEAKQNLTLWRSVEKTPPDMTKDVKYGKREYTAIDPQWQLRRATALWGPYGHRWGLRNIKYQIVEMKGNDVVTLQTKDAQGKVVQSVEQMADYIKYSIILEAEFFYPAADGKEASFPIINDDKYQADDEVLKKIITNTRSKALSWLGFSADVFLGKFDDERYVKTLTAIFNDLDAFVNTIATALRTAKDLPTLNKHKERLEEIIGQGTLDDVEKAQELRELFVVRKHELSAK